MPSFYTCFFHPQRVTTENSLDDRCPECGRGYDFPLESHPPEIGDYRIVRHLGRGFYGATYLAESGSLGVQDVLKVVPVGSYEFFGKDFEAECRLHKEVAEETEHVVPIRDMFEDELEFDGERARCHIAVLEYVPGVSLNEFVKDGESFQARSAAQVAIDLLRLLQELEAKGAYHNDLHGDNIRVKTLGVSARRADAIDESVRAIAIDLGSLSDESKSDPSTLRLGDLSEVASHLLVLSEQLLRDPDAVDDLEYRLAHAMRDIGLLMAPDALKGRVQLRDCEQMLMEAALSSISPWKPPGEMTRFSAAFNAQTMHPWFVPRLLVDPDDVWFGRISEPMCTLISGIRGCGKTMLLRALQFHARASDHEGEPGGAAAIRARLEKDDYVGLYVSCNRLLDGPGGGTSGKVVHEPYARLFVSYAREAIQAARHLREVDRKSVRADYHRVIGEVVAAHLSGAEDLGTVTSDAALERALQKQLVSLAKGERSHALTVNPALAFPALAEAVRLCSPIWASSVILFLLDDVSTRHLNKQSIEKLLSSLLFKDETCAFKMTTEKQTLDLLSPGLIEQIQLNRDIDTFDLGAEVNNRLRDRGAKDGGRRFLSDILARRAKQIRSHPEATPEAMLGGATLVSIASTIAGAKGKSRRERGSVYHGIQALQAACVGDIGDAIWIYESMLRRWEREGQSGIPISPKVQSASYQDYCVRRLYHLNRRGAWLRDIALSFAKASNQLLSQSYRKMQTRGKGRLRQYTTVHVNMASADPDTEKKLQELIDAGVFVSEGGPDNPRVKTEDADPVSQFILTYRKLYGFSSYIALSERDRFELSADDLQAWFKDPTNEKHLTSKLGGGSWRQSEEEVEPEEAALEEASEKVWAQTLFDEDPSSAFPPPEKLDEDPQKQKRAEVLTAAFLRQRTAGARQINTRDLGEAGVLSVIAGLGFEERALASAQQVFNALEPREAVLVKFEEPGYAKEITLAANVAASISTPSYQSFGVINDDMLPPGPVLVDITGLPKPLIFGLVREALRRDGRVFVTHTQATAHYPLNEDIKKLRDRHESANAYGVLEAARNEIFSGDRSPYVNEALLPDGGDAARGRLLCAGASAKHERLLYLLDHREYDMLQILVPETKSERTWLAQQAAAVARREAETAQVESVEGDDLHAVLKLIAERYWAWYSNGLDVELGLTGSKIEAAAFGALSATLKIAQGWYVRPKGFDPARFSNGVGETHHFELVLPPNAEGTVDLSLEEIAAEMASISPD